MVYHALPGLYPRDSAGYFIIWQGHRGVDIFFAISGFLITTRLLAEVREQGVVSLKSFYIRRFFRILPPLLLYLGVLAALAAIGLVAVSTWEWLGCCFFFRNYLPEPDVRGWYTAHVWSLSVEEHFYLLWPPLLVLCGRGRVRYAVAAAVFAVPIWRYFDQRFQILSPFGVGRTDMRIDALLWASIVAMLVEPPAVRDFLTKWMTPWLWLGVCIVIVVVAFTEPPLGLTTMAFLMPWILVGTIARPTALPSRVLEWRWLTWVGRLSYSLYLWQQLAISPVWVRVGLLSPETFWFWSFALHFSATFACAVVSYYLLERPLVRWGNGLAARVKLTDKVAMVS
jgi:peptidoglycan/LPS O-acetylase OafA/YrhL